MKFIGREKELSALEREYDSVTALLSFMAGGV